MNDLSIKRLSGIRRLFLDQKQFTIISNNCWAGWVYRRYGLEYQTPTIGLYMFAPDYIDFCYSLDKCLGEKLKFITVNESKYRDVLIERKQEDKPIGILGDKVEIVFLHYKNTKEAYEKWNRRTDRIHTDNLVFKFSEMDLCSADLIEKFDSISCKKKVCFTAKKYSQFGCCVPITKTVINGRVANDTTFYDNYIDITRFINNGELKYKSLVQR